MNFSSLKSRILALIGRAPNDLVYELVTADINTELSLIQMEATTTLTEGATVSLPLSFKRVVSLYRDADPRYALSPAGAAQIEREYQSSGDPTRYAVVDGSLLLDRPGAGNSLSLRYISELSDLSADGDENDVLTKYPSIYVYGALAHHGAITGDSRANGWTTKYEVEKKRAQKDSNTMRQAGLPGAPTARATD